MTSNVSSWAADLGLRDYVLAVGLLLVLIVVLARRQRVERRALILDGLFGAYLIFLAMVVLGPLPGLTPPPSFADAPAVSVNTTVDLRGFLGGGLDNQNGQNLLLLVPFGFGLPFVVHWRGWALVAASAILPLGIESVQLLVSLGVGRRYRSVDLTDWIANTAGALLGLALFVELAWALPRIRPEAGHRGRTAALAALAVVGVAIPLLLIGPSETPAYGSACEGATPTSAVTLTPGYSAYLDHGLVCLIHPGGIQAGPAGSSDQIVNPDERGLTVVGQAPASTSRAVVTLPDGRSAEAKLHQVQGLSGWLVYTAELGRPGDGSSSVRVEFFAADGKP